MNFLKTIYTVLVVSLYLILLAPFFLLVVIIQNLTAPKVELED